MIHHARWDFVIPLLKEQQLKKILQETLDISLEIMKS